jgi:isopenicillin N synthase-like dioxygenase
MRQHLLIPRPLKYGNEVQFLESELFMFWLDLHSENFRRVAKSVARIIALALDLDVDFFDRPEMLGEPIATLRLLHYEGGQKTGHAFVSNGTYLQGT